MNQVMLRPKTRPTATEPSRELAPELELLAQWMDTAFEIPGFGIRFGFDAILGLIPGLGDTATSLISLYILHAARRYGISRVTMLRMAANIALDYLVGSVPLLGDIFDVYWKANVKNVALLRRHVLVTPPEERRARRGDWLFLAAVTLGLVAVLVGCIACSFLVITWLWHLLRGVA